MQLIQFINKQASWRKVLLLLITSTLLGTGIITMLFGRIKLNPDAVMDSLSYYSSDVFFDNIETQGNEGRRAYLQLHMIDYLFISQFYVLLIFLINLLTRGKQHKQKGVLFSLLPLLSALMDLLENIFIDISLLQYPRKTLFLGQFSGTFTFIKMYSLYITFFLIIVLGFIFVIKRIKAKSQ